MEVASLWHDTQQLLLLTLLYCLLKVFFYILPVSYYYIVAQLYSVTVLYIVCVCRFYDNNGFEDDNESSAYTSFSEGKPLMAKSSQKSENYIFLLVLDAVLFIVEYLQVCIALMYTQIFCRVCMTLVLTGHWPNVVLLLYFFKN